MTQPMFQESWNQKLPKFPCILHSENTPIGIYSMSKRNSWYYVRMYSDKSTETT